MNITPVIRLIEAVLIRLNATANQKALSNTAAAPSPIYIGKIIKRFVTSATAVPIRQAGISEIIAAFVLFFIR